MLRAKSTTSGFLQRISLQWGNIHSTPLRGVVACCFTSSSHQHWPLTERCLPSVLNSAHASFSRRRALWNPKSRARSRDLDWAQRTCKVHPHRSEPHLLTHFYMFLPKMAQPACSFSFWEDPGTFEDPFRRGSGCEGPVLKWDWRLLSIFHKQLLKTWRRWFSTCSNCLCADLNCKKNHWKNMVPRAGYHQ